MYKNTKILLMIMIICITLVHGAKNMTTINRVSIIQLIANPDKYDGKNIRIIGFTVVGFENTSIYLSEVDAKHAIINNALWLSLNQTQIEKHTKNNGKYSMIEGKFKAGKTGHMGMYNGKIQEITRFDLWR